VVNDDRQPIGILSRIDLLHHLARVRTLA
jgi:hypothetical protein